MYDRAADQMPGRSADCRAIPPWRRTEGVSAVEFGLLLPLLMVILLGILDYGYVYFVRLTMTNAAREGARVGVTRESPGDVQNDAQTAATVYLTSANIDTATVNATQPDANGTVTVTVTVNPFTPLVGFVPTPSSMQVSAAMRWELAGAGP